jgi:hypothetical protein
MVSKPKRSVKEIAYIVGTVFCFLGFLSGMIFGTNSYAIVLLFLLGGFFSSKYIRLAQQRRDEYALSLFTAARAGRIEKFAVYLRPFYITSKIKVRYGKATHELEEILVNALSMPVFGLGKPGEVYGVGRILINEDSWRIAASELMSDATTIIYMPSHHPGTLWELYELLHDQYLAKTIFFMPRDPSPFWSKWNELRNDWDGVVADMKNRGLQIPPYNRKGLLFAIRPTGCFVEDFSLYSSGRLRAAIERLSSAAPNCRRFDDAEWQRQVGEQTQRGGST